jgi:hypothetical protein
MDTTANTAPAWAGLSYPYNGWYDGYYGPIYDGYWGRDGFFYYRSAPDARAFRRGDRNHFRRDAPPPADAIRSSAAISSRGATITCRTIPTEADRAAASVARARALIIPAQTDVTPTQARLTMSTY